MTFCEDTWSLTYGFFRTAEELSLHVGASIGYWQGDMNKIIDDIDALKPQLFIGVPRVFDRIYARVMSQLKTSALKRGLFKWASARKSHFMSEGFSQDKVLCLDLSNGTAWWRKLTGNALFSSKYRFILFSCVLCLVHGTGISRLTLNKTPFNVSVVFHIFVL